MSIVVIDLRDLGRHFGGVTEHSFFNVNEAFRLSPVVINSSGNPFFHFPSFLSSLLCLLLFFVLIPVLLSLLLLSLCRRFGVFFVRMASHRFDGSDEVVNGEAKCGDQPCDLCDQRYFLLGCTLSSMLEYSMERTSLRFVSMVTCAKFRTFFSSACEITLWAPG